MGTSASAYNSSYECFNLIKAQREGAEYLLDYRGRKIYNVESLKYYGTFANKPDYSVDVHIPIGLDYFCTDRKTTEGTTNGIMIYHVGSGVWVDSLGRIVE